MSQDRYSVQHRPEETRYVLIDSEAEDRSIEVIGEEQYVDVDSADSRQRIMFHTFIADDYNGMGLASALVRGAIDDAIAAGFSIVPVCRYVAAWLPKHPEYAGNVVQSTPEHLRAVSEATAKRR